MPGNGYDHGQNNMRMMKKKKVKTRDRKICTNHENASTESRNKQNRLERSGID